MFNTVPKAHVYFRHATHLNLDQPVKSHMDVTVSDFRLDNILQGTGLKVNFSSGVDCLRHFVAVGWQDYY